jgi:hypothetical protein
LTAECLGCDEQAAVMGFSAVVNVHHSCCVAVAVIANFSTIFLVWLFFKAIDDEIDNFS